MRPFRTAVAVLAGLALFGAGVHAATKAGGDRTITNNVGKKEERSERSGRNEGREDGLKAVALTPRPARPIALIPPLSNRSSSTSASAASRLVSLCREQELRPARARGAHALAH